MDFQGNIVRGRVEGLTPYKNIVNPLFDKLTDKSVDRVIVVGGGAKSPKIQVCFQDAPYSIGLDHL